MSSASRFLPHYSVEDYRQWQGDWELWQGIPVAMTPSPFGRHQQVALRLAVAVQSAIDSAGCRAVALAEIDWIISQDTVVRPDLVVVCGDAPPRHVEQPPAMVAEVLSPSTRNRDQREKFDLYRENGVGYYLILDPESSTLSAFQLESEGGYRVMDFESHVVMNVCGTCELAIAADYVFS